MDQSYPYAIASRKLNQANRNYSGTNIEALAFFWALKYYREITLGYIVHVLTDQYIKYILIDSYIKGRQAKWVDTLLELNPKTDYTPAHRSHSRITLSVRRRIETSPPNNHDGLLFRESASKKLCGPKQRLTFQQLVITEVLVPTVLKLLHNSHTLGYQGIFFNFAAGLLSLVFP